MGSQDFVTFDTTCNRKLQEDAYEIDADVDGTVDGGAYVNVSFPRVGDVLDGSDEATVFFLFLEP